MTSGEELGVFLCAVRTDHCEPEAPSHPEQRDRRGRVAEQRAARLAAARRRLVHPFANLARQEQRHRLPREARGEGGGARVARLAHVGLVVLVGVVGVVSVVGVVGVVAWCVWVWG